MAENRFADIGILAALALRNGVDGAIANIERLLKEDQPKQVTGEIAAYFESQRAGLLDALKQLKDLRADVHARVFEAHREEAA